MFKKFIFVYIFLHLTILIFSQEMKLGEYEVIQWCEDCYLSWDDFKGVDYRKNDFKGNAHCTILILGYPQDIDGKINMNVINLFIKAKSSKSDAVNKQLLEHEQIHFNISEYYTRLIRFYLTNISFDSRREAQNFVNLIIRMYNNVQDQFEMETEHGNSLIIQNKWKIDIDCKIKELNSYSKTAYTNEEFKNFEKRIKAKYAN